MSCLKCVFVRSRYLECNVIHNVDSIMLVLHWPRVDSAYSHIGQNKI